MKVWLIAAFFVAGAISVSASDNFADSASHFNLIDSTSASPHALFSPLLDDSISTGWPTGDIYATGDFMPTYCGSGVWDFINKAVWQDGYLYCTAPNGLLIFDVHDPEWIKPAAQLFLPGGRATDVAVRGSLAYVTSRGDTSTGVWRSYLRVIDISDPHYPAIVGELKMENGAMSVALNGNFAYVGGYLGIYTVDITDPSDMQVVDFDGIQADYQRSVSVAVANGFLYAGCWDLHIFNLNNPADPQLISILNTPGYPSKLYVRDTILFTGNQAEVFIFEDPWSGLSAINVADPANPRLCSNRSFRGAAASVVGYDSLIAVGTSRGIYWFDLFDDSLEQVASYPWGECLAYDGTYLFAGISDGCISVVLSDEKVPTELGTWENWIYPYDVAVVSDWAYAVADDQTRMAAIYISPDGDMTVTSTTEIPAWAWDVVATDSLVVVTTRGGGVAIFSRSNPGVPAHLSTFPLPKDAWTAEIYGNLVYVATTDYGLVILDITDPTNPQLVKRFLEGTNVSDVAIEGNYLYFPAYGYGLAIADISDPRNPVLVGTYPNELAGSNVFVEDHIAYTDMSGATAIDVSDPANPVLLGQFHATPGRRNTTFLPGRKHAAVTLDYDGVILIDLSDPTNMHIDGWYDTPCVAYDLFATEEHLYIGDICSVIRLCLPLPTDVPIVNDTAQSLPTTFGLMPCYPNPFNSETTIPFSLERGSDISITIYNVLGERVRTVFNGRASAGINSAHWDGTTDNGTIVASGMYVVVLETPDQRSSRRVLLIK